MSPPLQTRRQVVRRFVIRFAGSCLVFFTVINWIPSGWVAEPANILTAKLLGLVLELLGLTAAVNGVVVQAGGFSVKIITECTAIFVFILFFAFLFSYPASVKDKAIGLAVGIPALFCFNLFRLVLVFFTGMKRPEFFNMVHVYFGQIAMVLVVLTACMMWLKTVTGVSTGDRPASFVCRFLAWSTLPFLFWLGLHEAYVLTQLHGIQALLRLFGYEYRVMETVEIYPTSFNTFNLVTFTALILATQAIQWRRKVKALIIGLALLSVTHFAFRFSQILFVDYDQQFAFRPFIALIIINEWILPFVLWLAVVWKAVFKASGIHTCPVCGKQVKGLADHVKAMHGAKALADESVKELMNGA